MSNHTANFACDCCDCGERIDKGDDIWFCDEGKLCEGCADEREIICPDCGGHKKPDYETCYGCKEGDE